MSDNLTLVALILLLTSNNTITTTQLLLLLALLSTSHSKGFCNNLFGNNASNT